MYMFRIFLLILLLATVACEDPAAGSSSNSGNKLWVSISGAGTFFPHNLWFEVFDSASGETVVGWGVISMNEDGTGSSFLRNPGDGTERLLEDGTWWLYILADMDNSIADWSVILPRTTGDKFTGMLSVNIAGATVTNHVTPADFSHTEP